MYNYYYYSVLSYLFLLFLGKSDVIRGELINSNDCLNQRCGSIVNVSYPFNILHSNCPSFNDDGNFTLNCTNDVLYLGSNLPVLSILEDSLIIELGGFKSTYNQNGICNLTASTDDLQYRLHFQYGGPYIAAGDNQFGSFGCSAGFLFTYQSEKATAYDTGGCEPFCGFDDQSYFPILNKSSYAGCGDKLNCCVSNFPAPAKVTYYFIQSLPSDPSPCGSFAIPFHPNYTNFQNNTYGFRVLWALPDPHVLNELKSINSSATSNNIFNVADLPGNMSTACSPGNSSQVIIVNELPGYRCSCLPGYRGDGYAHGRGCIDIDECNKPGIRNLCVASRAECRNANGSFTCHCKSRWHVGDGMRNGTGCAISPSLIEALTITGGVMGMMLLFFSIIGASILVDSRRRRQYFKQNGGFELQDYIAAGTGRQTTRFYTAGELREATQNFSEHLKLGAGGFGTVYRGTLKDKRVVAVKKANQPGEADKNQFLNEMAILTQINHRHIVRLHGCCLETANPLLVYEFVSNGDLAENLASARAMGWAKRLQVATQVADALAYLHAAASPPILHRDVKTANILLDDNLDAKVADFGISRLIPEGEKCVSTVVQGTLGYLDPEYFQTLQLTDKSDVYSLGVVLVELITGLKAVDNHQREVRFANLALLFIDTMRTPERLQDLVDARLHQDITGVDAQWRLHSSVQYVARLARRCLALEGVERPSMSELAVTLHQIFTAFESRPDQSAEELTPLISGAFNY